MKKAILAPLLSALVVPGLGQVTNQQLKKGAGILVAVFVLFVVGAVHFYRVLSRVLKAAHTSPSAHGTLLDRLGAEDLSPLWYLLAAFAVVWLYSVIDAYRTGKKMDREGEKATP